jgi:hypothetical protein
MVRLQAHATDPDLPAQQLFFSLTARASANAHIDPVTGQFDWLADVQPGTNSFTVSVSDSGSPPLSSSQSFSVIVVDQPHIQEITLLAPDTVIISWSAIPGQRYRLDYKQSLDETQWTTLPSDITAESSTASVTDSTANARFYRIRVMQE